ncbi:hypothetical protein NEF87_001536 [Candidatus Lokiarchaeum ossiferum]|uniref:Carboxypeptidase regulatory-like domain-containing protein n=1 Tax=Candidatus Lokiarchaeum ossiferum TaxID=2951803 RepID=A0ABY6HP01_9ARCH|nr:hypothetical protein NEF87_001536 [Candidatus Lokiarchaeum sp. B-35]
MKFKKTITVIVIFSIFLCNDSIISNIFSESSQGNVLHEKNMLEKKETHLDEMIANPISSAASSFRWWDESYEYRIEIEVSPNGVSQTDAPVQLYLNFTEYFNEFDLNNRVNASSLRLIEQTTSGSANSIPMQYDPAISDTSDNGELAWIIEGSFGPSISKTYFLYFCLGNTNALNDPIIRHPDTRGLNYGPLRLFHEGFERSTLSGVILDFYDGNDDGYDDYYLYSDEVHRGASSMRIEYNDWRAQDVGAPIPVIGETWLTYSTFAWEAYGTAEIVGCAVSNVRTSYTNEFLGIQNSGSQTWAYLEQGDYVDALGEWNNFNVDLSSFATDIEYLVYIFDDDSSRSLNNYVLFDDMSIWNVTVNQHKTNDVIPTLGAIESVSSNLEVQVLDIDGFPVPNAVVTINKTDSVFEQIQSTDENGYTVFTNVLINQRYNITIEYLSEGRTETFIAAFIDEVLLDEFDYSILIQSNIWSMDFHVNDFDDLPISNARVVVYNDSISQEILANSTVDSNGYTTIRCQNYSNQFDYEVFYDTTFLPATYVYNDPIFSIYNGTMTRTSTESSDLITLDLIDQSNFDAGSGNFTSGTLFIISLDASLFNSKRIGYVTADFINFDTNITEYYVYGTNYQDIEVELLHNASIQNSNITVSTNGIDVKDLRFQISDTSSAQSGKINVSYYERSTEFITANLTTISFNVSALTQEDGSNQPLSNAICMFSNASSSESIANITTPTDGQIDYTYFRYTPSSYGNYSLGIEFVGEPQSLNKTSWVFDPLAVGSWSPSLDFSMDTAETKDVLVDFLDLSSYQTKVEINSTGVNLYWGESQSFAVNFSSSDGEDPFALLDADNINYFVYDQELVLVLTSSMQRISQGIYQFTLNSSNLVGGNYYTLEAVATKAGYPVHNKTTIPLQVFNLDTSVSIIDESNQAQINKVVISKIWGEQFDVTLVYQHNSQDLSGASVLLNWDYETNALFSEQSSGEFSNYTYEIDTLKALEIGQYRLEIVVTLQNYTSQNTWIDLIILPIATDINRDDYASALEKYWNENLTLSVNFTDTINNLPVSGATVYYNLVGDPEFNAYYISESNEAGIYNITLNSTSFGTTGSYTLQVVAQKDNYQSQQMWVSINVNIIPTSISTASTQISRNFGESFVLSINYYDEHNSSSLPITNADLVSYSVSGPDGYTGSGTLTHTSSGIYNSTVFYTDDFPESGGTFYYTITATKEEFQQKVIVISVDIDIRPTDLTSLESQIDVFWNQNFTLSLTYEDLTIPASPIGITDGSVSYSVVGKSAIFGDLIHIANGNYQMELNSTVFTSAGTYTIQIEASKVNYGTRSLSILLNISKIPVNLVGNDEIDVFWGEGFTVSVTLTDSRDDSPILDSNVDFSVSGSGYSDLGILNHQSSNPGVYSFDFNSINFDHAGTYTFTITATKNQYETVQMSIVLTISIVPTDLVLNGDSVIEVIWGENFVLSVTFTDEQLASSIPINDGTVSFTISPVGVIASGFLTPQGSGIYYLSLNSETDIGGNGTYTITMTATKNQYLTQQVVLTVDVSIISTILTADELTISKQLNQNFNISVSYLDNSDSQNPIAITDGSISYVVSGPSGYSASGTISHVGGGTYNITFNTDDDFPGAGTYTFIVVASKDEYQSRQLTVIVDINLIKTNLTLIYSDEIEYFWGENFTIGAYYEDVVDPQDIQEVIGGQISYNVSSLSEITGFLNYIGSNEFRLEFNTTQFGQNGTYTIQLDAFAETYGSRQALIVLTIKIIPTSLSSNHIDDEKVAYWGDIFNISVNLMDIRNLSVPAAIIGGPVTYSAVGYGNGIFTDSGMGLYTLELNTIDFGKQGTYTFRVKFTKSQYETNQIYITVYVNGISTSISAEATSFDKTWKENFTVSVSFFDTHNDGPITDGEISYYVGQVSGFTGYLTPIGGGVYEIELNSTEFLSVGSYTMHLEATKYQYQTQNLVINVKINRIQTSINNSIFVNLDTSINVTTGYQMIFAYEDSEYVGISNAIVAYYEWEFQGITHEGQLVDIGDGKYLLDFNTATRQVGMYFFVVHLGQANYIERSASITLNIKEKPISLTLSAELADKIVEMPEGENIVIEFSLYDPVAQAPLTGAAVSMNYRGSNWTVEETDTLGTYRYVIDTASIDYNALLAAKTEIAIVSVDKANYTIEPFTITISVTPPEFTVGNVGVPKIFVFIGGAVGLLAIVIAGVTKYVQYANIPMIIKKINATKKDIEKNNEIGESNISISSKEEIVERLKDRWDILDLDLASILGVNDVKTASDSVITTGDEEVGGL